MINSTPAESSASVPFGPSEMRLSGYSHPLYAQSLAQFGQPTHLSESGGWLLTRPIGATALSDAIGPYPLFCCANWMALESDLNKLAGGLVTVSVVLDPFAPISRTDL